ncbi:hypothetical protein BT96DRAFT_965793 [Gymnopus androsaceus JB14]|uniref:Uncharacterized protein n=1 Tax=Gymnopus androsaceus JB14 TaxID=1447944 RepID=A0A6A4HPI1_9AGAR|nr:hypothetical protein BT96DRAFT_965793 [Gymnopus androsaceus JB14]
MQSNRKTINASSSKDPAEYLCSATFSKSEGSSVSPENAVTASDLLLGSYDPAKLHPLADLGDKLDYHLLDNEKTSELPGSGTAIPSRGWSDDLCYGTGTMYLSGLAVSGVWGLREGASRPLAVSNTRLQINSTFIRNSAGVLALVYNGVNSSIDTARGKIDRTSTKTHSFNSNRSLPSSCGVDSVFSAFLGIVNGEITT